MLCPQLVERLVDPANVASLDLSCTQGLHIVLADDPFLQNADLFIHESGSQKSCGMWNAPQPSSIYCTHKRTRLLHSSFLILPATCSGVKYPGLIYNDIRR
jgi:hypothetical protein